MGYIKQSISWWCFAQGDMTIERTAGNPGRNELDERQELQYRPIIQAIAATGYTGYLGQEFIPTENPEAALRQAFEICNIHIPYTSQQ